MRARAARALLHAGRAEDARALQSLPPIADEPALERARGVVMDVIARALDATVDAVVEEDVLQALFAAGEAVAMARAEAPKPAQMRELVQALHFTARFA